MKIVQVIPALARGGAERVVIDLANQLAGHRHEVCLVTALPVDRSSLPVALDPSIELVAILGEGAKLRSVYPKLISWVISRRNWLFAGYRPLSSQLRRGLRYGALGGADRKWLRPIMPPGWQSLSGNGRFTPSCWPGGTCRS